MKRKLILAEAPQPHILRNHLENASVAHGETITADLEGVRLWKESEGGTVSLYFCPMDRVVVKKKTGSPDEADLPETVQLHGYLFADEFVQDGRYNLRNVQIQMNGAMHVTVTDDCPLELIEAE